MSDENLYLVGTLPYDTEGKIRLDRAFQRLSPATIAMQRTLDKDLYGLEVDGTISKESYKGIFRHLGLRLNSRQRATFFEMSERIRINMGYDTASAIQYA